MFTNYFLDYGKAITVKDAERFFERMLDYESFDFWKVQDYLCWCFNEPSDQCTFSFHNNDLRSKASC